MQKLQESVFSIIKTTSLSPAVFSFLQPSEEFSDETPLGGVLRDTKYGWLALGPKFCVVDLRSGLKVAAKTFGIGLSSRITVTGVVELPTPLTENSQQLVISLDCDSVTSLIYVFHINGSQVLRCIQTNVVITELAVCDALPSGPLTCFDGCVMAGTKKGEILVFDLNRASLLQALKDISQGYEHLVKGENNVTNLIFLPLKAVHKIESQHDLAVENDDHLGILFNEDSFLDGQYVFRNPDGTVRMKAKQNHVRVTVTQYIPQLGSLAVGFNFGAFQIWNLLNLELEFTSQVNVECLPVTHFGFQEPCDDPRAFCYLWVVFSVIDRFEKKDFPLAVMYSLTYQGKGMLNNTKCLYQEFSMATIRFQIELSAIENIQLVGGRCISCHTYSINSTLGEEGEDTMLNLCQLIWECWGNNPNMPTQHGMLLFDLDQWYKDQMPATYPLENNAFISVSRCPEVSRGSCLTLDIRLDPASVSPYSHATRLEEHFFPNSLQCSCTWLNTSESSVLHTVGVQRQLVRGVSAAGPGCLLAPARLYTAAATAGLRPLYSHPYAVTPEDQRRYLLSVALEGRLSRFLKRCAHDWATGTHSGVGCTLPFLVDWTWKRAIELKENAKDLTAPLFTSATVPDRNVVRCLEHCVQQLSQLTGLLDAVFTKCCNLVVPDALNEMEEKHLGIGTVSLYFQVVQWFVRVGLLPERLHSYDALPYPAQQLGTTYSKRRVKLHRLQDKSEEDSVNESCSLLYIDQLIEKEFGGERVHKMWMKAGSECGGLYPPPSLYALLRLYLLPDISEEHKHSLLLYLLLDYSMLYDDMRYEAVIRRLMQFPTMFGLSNTAIKATQAFWHLDHRDFDFALDQLQCLTGNTLSDWQHHVVLSSLLAQNKTQAALQYLHVRKPPPIQNKQVNDNDKLEDWQCCCDLYLARELVFEALDVIRMCVQNAGSVEDKKHFLDFFYRGCHTTGQLAKLLQATLLPYEEEVFISYLKECNEPQTTDILVMYYLQQARYLEAQQYTKQTKGRARGASAGGAGASAESLLEVVERESAREALVDTVCAALPAVSVEVARVALGDFEHHIIRPKPMSVYVQANSPKNTFTYKSSFIQNTIENASETWINKPKLRKGIKRALNIEDTPFICTPKTFKSRSLLSEQKDSEASPAKRAKVNLTGTPRKRKAFCTLKVSDTLSRQMASLLDMPEVESPHQHYERSGAGTPHSILKNRRPESRNQDALSPVDSRYLGDSDEEFDTASNHTHYSDANKHLRFTIPTSSEADSTPSPIAVPIHVKDIKEESQDSNDHEEYGHRSSPTAGSPLVESPPKRFAAEEVKEKKSYKDTVKARKSLSLSVNSSLSDDPNSSIESIADIPITLINPRYAARNRHISISPHREIKTDTNTNEEAMLMENVEKFVPRTPSSRRSIRSGGSDTASLGNRSHSATPERQDSPIVTPIRRSRSRTPELSPRSSLASIPELPKQEAGSEPHTPAPPLLTVPRQLRSRSRTPERVDKIIESPRLEAIKELPAAESPLPSPTPRSLRSRSHTPEVEVPEQHKISSPRSLRSRSKTPEKLMSPKKELSRNQKSLSRMVLEANAFAKTKQTEAETMETETTEEKAETIDSTPMKSSKNAPSFMDVTFSPIVNKSVLQSSSESFLSVTIEKPCKTDEDIKQLPAFTSITETYTERSVLHSYESSTAESSVQEKDEETPETKPLPTFPNIHEDFGKSVLQSCESSVDTSAQEPNDKINLEKPQTLFKVNESDFTKPVLSEDSTIDASKTQNLVDSSLMTSDSDVEVNWKTQETARVMKEKEKIVEIEREINEIEGEMSDECRVESDSEVVEESSSSSESESSEEESGPENERRNEVISIADSEESVDKVETNELVPEPEEKVMDAVTVEEVEHIPMTEEEIIIEMPAETNRDRVEVDPVPMIEEVEDEPNLLPNMSILTDDNSIVDSESVNLNYSDENREDIKSKEATTEVTETDPVQVVTVEEIPTITKEKQYDQKTKDLEKEPVIIFQSFDVVDNIISEPEIVDIQEEKSDSDEKEKNYAEKQHKTVSCKEHEETGVKETVAAISIEEMEIDQTPALKSKKSSVSEDEVNVGDSLEEKKEDKTKDTSSTTKSSQDKDFTKVEAVTEKIKESISMYTEETKTDNQVKVAEAANEQSQIDAVMDKTIPSRKRTKSTSAAKFLDIDVPKTPSTRKRAQSVNISGVEDKAEVNVSTPTRAKTPSELRKIITRRASKELSERLADDSIAEETPTPRRRTVRSRSKKEDDNVSVASTSKEIEKLEDEPKDIITPRRRIVRSKNVKDDDNISVASTSKEAEKVEDETQDIITPRQRTVRSRSKKDDDNISVASTSKEAEKVEDETQDIITPRQRTVRSRSKKDDDYISVASTSKEAEKVEVETQDIITPRQRTVRSRSKKDDDYISVASTSKEAEKVEVETQDIITPRQRTVRSRSKKDDDYISVASTSKEAEKVEVETQDIITPRQRTVRSRSKKDDDNISVASTSKEAEKVEVETQDIITPRQRTVRSRSKKDDDNISVASTSKEAEKVEDETQDIITPRQRTVRSRSKKDDDNISVASTSKEAEKVEVETQDIITPRQRTVRSRSKKNDNISAASTSKEAEKIEDDLEDIITPRRRSVRSRSKKDDDNASVVSDVSVKSSKSRMSEENETKVRKGRKSILSAKPDLSVIPEVAAEESKGESFDIIELGARRLTRNQKAVLESWLEPKAKSTASRSEVDDDENSSTHSMDPYTMDRINLLNKPDFEGSPDPDEMTHSLDIGFSSEQPRMSRAASETKALPNPAKVVRSLSVDIEGASDLRSPYDSPLRARRASFARACEALHTPKRRPSTDQRRSEARSEQGSPSEVAEMVTPARRPRRVSSTSAKKPTKSEADKEIKE